MAQAGALAVQVRPVPGQGRGHRSPVLALLPWGNVIEDFLDELGVSLEEFCTTMTGGWLFGYVAALQRSGIRTTIFCISREQRTVARFSHAATGATTCVLPEPAGYAVARRRLGDVYDPGGRKNGEARRTGRLQHVARLAVRDVAFYLATPVRLLAREIQREGAAAILCQEYEYARFDVSVLLGKLLGMPVFGTFQGGDWQYSRIERFVRPLAIRRCAGLIVPSSSEADRVVRQYGVDPGRIARIFNPLDIELWRAEDRGRARVELGLPANARIAIWHGRVDIPRKGLDVLLHAWRNLTRRNARDDLRLVLVGSGADNDELARHIRELSLRGVDWRNQYLLDRPLLRRYLSAADVYVLPSRHEGFPVAPLEAMACGLPVIAADAQGVADIFAGGPANGGTVVPRGDAVALAAALEPVLLSPSRSRELGSAARRRVEAAFSLDAVGLQLAGTLFPQVGAGRPAPK